VDGNRTHQRPRKRPLNGFEGRGTQSAEDATATSYDDQEKRIPLRIPPEVENDPDLLLVVENWSALHAAVRAGIVAMVNASRGGDAG